ncbi:MAG: N-acetylneuraminate synthase [Elusimicrobia bacterium]|nr:N-acetylneuraminate synthase [Elusimicrobiota bacterium]
MELALRLIDAAAAAGADAVKFQTFRSEKVISRGAAKAEYQRRNTGSDESQLEMVRRLELGRAAHRRLAARCRAAGILFLSTPFDSGSLRFLARGLRVPRLKIPSGEVTNAPLLMEFALAGRPLVLSTGMATLGEVEEALGVLAYGFLHGRRGAPARRDFLAAFADPRGRELLRRRVTLLHCTTEYPAPFGDVNLRAMDTLAAAFGLPVGYSDHTRGIAVPVAAAARGAVFIEKHFTLDRGLPGPDHKASLEPAEMKAMVSAIRQVEAALGSPLKAPAPSELKNMPIARRSLVAARPVAKGARFTARDLDCKRPGGGVSPMRYWEVLGRRAARAYRPDEPIRESD